MLSNENFENVAAGLAALARVQKLVSGMHDRGQVESPTRSDILETVFALQFELSELAEELGWKSWKNEPEMTDERIQRAALEFADVLAFLGLLMVQFQAKTGWGPDDVAVAYSAKTRENVRRFSGLVKGYETPANGKRVGVAARVHEANEAHEAHESD